MSNELARDIERILSVEMGDFIATSMVRKNCELIGTTPDDLTADQLVRLAEGIEKSVSFFKDISTASVLSEKIMDLK